MKELFENFDDNALKRLAIAANEKNIKVRAFANENNEDYIAQLVLYLPAGKVSIIQSKDRILYVCYVGNKSKWAYNWNELTFSPKAVLKMNEETKLQHITEYAEKCAATETDAE
jgi:hypothetical protein